MNRDPVPNPVLHLERTASTFVEIVQTLVEEFDVIDVLTGLTSSCVELIGATAAGILLADGEGYLRVIGASTEQINLLELFQIQNDEGPCLDCYSSGESVIVTDLRASTRWPRFSVECVNAGFPSVCALPLRLSGVTLGCLNLFMNEPVGLSATEVDIAQALANAASIVMVQDQAVRESAISRTHLQDTFNGRIAIEQAKGMIAEGTGVDMDTAFKTLRTYATSNSHGLTSVAESLVAGTLTVASVRA